MRRMRLRSALLCLAWLGWCSGGCGVSAVPIGPEGAEVVPAGEGDFEASGGGPGAEAPALASVAAGTALTVVPRGAGGLGPSELTAGGGVKEGSVQKASEEGVSGTFVLTQLTGTPGSEGVVPAHTGMFGGHGQLVWASGRRLSVDFAVPCTRNVEEQGGP